MDNVILLPMCLLAGMLLHHLQLVEVRVGMFLGWLEGATARSR